MTRRRGAVVVLVASAGTAAVILGVNGLLGRDHPVPGAGGGPDAKRVVDVLHNPPVIFDPGAPVVLEFTTVCPGSPCAGKNGTVHVETADGRSRELTPTESDGVAWTFVVPAELTGRTFTYRADFDIADAADMHVGWPSNGGGTAVGTAVPFDGRVADVDLGSATFAARDQNLGVTIATVPWGDGTNELGIDDAGVGPTSFDVDDDGDLLVLDTANTRLVTIDPKGARAAASIELDRDMPDIALDGGDLYVLYPNGAGPGEAYIGRYARTGGRQLERIALTGGGAGMVRRRDSRVEVYTQDSSWTPAVDHGRPVAVEQQRAAVGPGARVGERTVYVKHVGDHEVRVAALGPDGSRVAWRVRSKTALGPSLIAEPLGDDVLLVQSRFSDHASEYAVVLLRADGSFSSFNVPSADFAETTSGSEFRLRGDALYALRATRSGATFARYALTTKAVDR
jgi:hypothetical protein